MTNQQNSIQGLSSYEAEYNLLCIFYQHKDALGYLAEKITPDFFTDVNKILFTAIFELYQTCMSIDIITISHMLKKLPNGNRVPENHIKNLVHPVSIEKIEAYLSILTEEYNTRRTRTMCIEIEKALKEKKPSSMISEIVQKYSFDTNLGSSRPKNISVVVENYKKELQEDIIAGNDSETRLLKFGVEELDRHDSMRPGNIYTFAGRPSQGKMLALHELILTPTGFKKLMFLKVGDEVSSIDGKPSFITGYFPQGKKQMYRLTLEDGREIMCGAEHLWEINIDGVNDVVNTLQVIELLKTNKIFIPPYRGLSESKRKRKISLLKEFSNRCTFYKNNIRMEVNSLTKNIFKHIVWSLGHTCFEADDGNSITFHKAVFEDWMPKNIRIVKVEKTDIFEECACIAVSHERSLYVAGDYIMTHNTSIALQSLHFNAFTQKKRVAIFSLEMSAYEVLEKMYCYHNLIDSQTYIKMKPEKKLKEIQKFEAYLVANEIEFIIDDECKTLSAILNRTKVLNAQKKLDLVCIDYIQLIEASLSNRNKADEIELIMNSIKNDIAMKYKCVVITLSQMSKALEKEGYRFPILADLLNGGAIEAASTSVYFLHSVPTNIRRFFDDEGCMQNNGEHLFVAHKVRYGQKGILKMWFAGGANKFVKDYSERENILAEVEKRCQAFMKN